MSLDWMDISLLDFKTLLLLERVQISWFPRFSLPEAELSTALRAHPTVDWYLRHKCPQVDPWLDQVLAQNPQNLPDLRQAELAVLRRFEDLLVYVHDPAIYDAQPFLNWDSNELLSLVDFKGKTVIDVGAGTGRLTFLAREAKAVFPVEPVENLRRYMREKANALGLDHIFPVDGLVTRIPFPNGFADITMGGHVFGDAPVVEYEELRRVTSPGGMIVLCPGNSDRDDLIHQFLLDTGFSWGRFEEPRDGWKRKYWKQVQEGTCS
jgi:SAM-dependent methyltransferase